MAVLRAEAAAGVLQEAELHPLAEPGLSNFEGGVEQGRNLFIRKAQDREALVARQRLSAQ